MVNSVSETIIDRRYRLEELLGEGGSGSTYRATRLSDSATVAIKILSLQHLNDWKQLELFEREAQILAQLDHPQIPKYLEYFHVDSEQDRAFCIVQQLAPGQPLNALVQSGWRGTPAEVSSIAQQILEILQYLQSQSPPLIHRDIKPHNIVRNEDGRVFLVDFGAVQATYHNTLMKGNTVAGTYGYMAPEQFRGRASIASDLYGLGATVLYLLTHRSPADLPQARLKISFRSHVQIPESLADWLETMLEPDEKNRFPSATKALQALTSKRYRQATKARKIGFPWRGTAAVVGISLIVLSVAHQYRYAFLTVVGLQPSDLCDTIARGENDVLNDYLNHGGTANAMVPIGGILQYNNIPIGKSNYNSNQGSLLHCAVASGQILIAQQLLGHGADLRSVDSMNRNVMHRLVDRDRECSGEFDCKNSSAVNLVLLKLFVAKDKSIVNIINPNNESPLSMAVQQHKPTMVQQLIDFGADPNVVGDRGNGLFHMLLEQESDRGIDRNKALIPKILGILVKQNIDINKDNESGDRPLHLATKYHSVKIADLLLQHNADPNLTNKEGRTPLMVAIHGKKNKWIAKLLTAGTNVNTQDKAGLTPLHLLMQSLQGDRTDRDAQTETQERTKKLEIAQALFARGANPNLTDHRGRSPLHVLAESELSLRADEQSCVRLAISLHPLFAPLLSQRANFKAVNSDGDSVLHIVARYPKLVRQLVAMGADPLQRNREGRNVLVVMTDGHDLTPEELRLLQIGLQGGNLNVQDAQGNTAIHRLLIERVRDPLYDTKIEKLISNLLDLGASLDILNNKYQTPLDIARQNTASVKNSIEKYRAQHLQRQINQCKLEADSLKDGRS
jgi:ankyrin repeat protein